MALNGRRRFMPVQRTKLDRVCVGSSMVPTVLPGDCIQVVEGRSPRPGEAVLFESADGTCEIVHRFVFKVPLLPLFVHRGDSVRARVALAHCSRIVGVAVLDARRPSPRDVYEGWALVARRVARKLRAVVRL
jgi:hypothetical protein